MVALPVPIALVCISPMFTPSWLNLSAVSPICRVRVLPPLGSSGSSGTSGSSGAGLGLPMANWPSPLAHSSAFTSKASRLWRVMLPLLEADTCTDALPSRFIRALFSNAVS